MLLSNGENEQEENDEVLKKVVCKTFAVRYCVPPTTTLSESVAFIQYIHLMKSPYTVFGKGKQNQSGKQIQAGQSDCLLLA